MTMTPAPIESLCNLHRSQANDALPWLAAQRDAAWQRATATPWPTRKTEAWKYTSLATIAATQAWQIPAPTDFSTALAQRSQITELDCLTLVFVDGHLHTDLTRLDTPAELVRFRDANAEQSAWIARHLGSTIKPGKHLFTELNTSLLDDGLLIRLPRNTRLPHAIRLLHLYSSGTPADPAPLVTTRLLVHAEPGSEATLIEQFDSLDQPCAGLANHVSEWLLADNAQLTHIRLQLEHESLQSVHGTHVHLQRDSRYHQHQTSLGGRLKRNDLQVTLLAPNAQAQLDGIFLAKHDQHIDNQTALDHVAPHGHSQETYKGLITDQAKAVFNGRIHIHPDAQKTEAHLSNKNLLLSAQAEIDTKPELEIYADDVKCSHGATIGQLDETSLFYFQSRGIDRAAAEAMLCFGFVNEMVERLPNQALRDFATARLSEYLHDIEQLKALTL